MSSSQVSVGLARGEVRNLFCLGEGFGDVGFEAGGGGGVWWWDVEGWKKFGRRLVWQREEVLCLLLLALPQSSEQQDGSLPVCLSLNGGAKRHSVSCSMAGGGLPIFAPCISYGTAWFLPHASICCSFHVWYIVTIKVTQLLTLSAFPTSFYICSPFSHQSRVRPSIQTPVHNITCA